MYLRVRKAQSAMEYLMTYGWAILIIAVVLGALFSLGIFNSATLAPKALGRLVAAQWQRERLLRQREQRPSNKRRDVHEPVDIRIHDTVTYSFERSHFQRGVNFIVLPLRFSLPS